MREPLVAWAGDCRVRGEVDLDDGRLDQVNEGDLLTFFGATLEALEDGHEVVVEELEVERRELHLIEVEGHQGDPNRRLRTITDPVRLEIGPFRVTGNLHRSPASQPFAALTCTTASSRSRAYSTSSTGRDRRSRAMPSS